MSSPLNEFHNSIFYIPTNTGAMTQDSKGNWIPGDAVELEYKAYLKRSTKEPNINYSIGVNKQGQYFEGYLTDPLFLPESFQVPATIRCQKRQGQSWIEGKFELIPQLLPVELVEQIIGQAIEGWLIIHK